MTRPVLETRNIEIRLLYDYLRKVEFRTSDYALKFIEENYFLGKVQIYKILAEGVSHIQHFNGVSSTFKKIFPKGYSRNNKPLVLYQ